MAGRAKPAPEAKPAPRTSIAVQGARVHNLKNVSVELPRDSLTVITGLSGSGKSSLAFDTIYAEGQRRYMESLSSYAKRFVAQVAKPDVDFVFGLSPVISIEQKTTGSNPRSTVGTMTDIASYLNLLFAAVAEARCPRTGEPVHTRSTNQILEAILTLPERTQIELRAPVFRVYGEELDFVFTEIRKKGCREILVDGKRLDLWPRSRWTNPKVKNMDVVVDHFLVGPQHEKAIKAGIAATLLIGDGLMQVQVLKGAGKTETERFYSGLCSRTHHFVYGGIEPRVFHVQQSGERLPDRLGRSQGDAPGTAGARSEAERARRLFRARSVQIQSRHMGWPGDVQPGEGYALLSGRALGKAARGGARRHAQRSRRQKLAVSVPPDAKVKREEFEGHEVGLAGLRAASNEITVGTGSAAKLIRAWRSGWTR